MVLKCKKKFSPTKIDLVSCYFDFDMVGASVSLENKALLLLVSCDKKTKVLLIFKIKLTWYGKLEICIIHSDKKSLSREVSSWVKFCSRYVGIILLGYFYIFCSSYMQVYYRSNIYHQSRFSSVWGSLLNLKLLTS